MLLAAANDAGCHFGHHCCRRTSPNSIEHKVNKNILISTLIYWFYQNPLTAASERTCARLPATWRVWIHWIHTAGGVSGSITIVVVFVGCLCCCGWTLDVTSLAGNVGDMSATCRRHVEMSMNLGIFACGCRHQNSPDTRFLCWKLPTLYPGIRGIGIKIWILEYLVFWLRISMLLSSHLYGSWY